MTKLYENTASQCKPSPIGLKIKTRFMQLLKPIKLLLNTTALKQKVVYEFFASPQQSSFVFSYATLLENYHIFQQNSMKILLVFPLTKPCKMANFYMQSRLSGVHLSVSPLIGTVSPHSCVSHSVGS